MQWSASYANWTIIFERERGGRDRKFSLFKGFLVTFHVVSVIAFLITIVLVMLSAVGKFMSEAHCVWNHWRMASSEIRTQLTLSIRWDSLARDAFHGTSSRTRSEGNLWYLRRTTGEGHATPLDFTTQEVVRETFRWRVRSLPLLVQITFRTLNLFREVGRRPLARAGESFAFSTVYSLLI